MAVVSIEYQSLPHTKLLLKVNHHAVLVTTDEQGKTSFKFNRAGYIILIA